MRYIAALVILVAACSDEIYAGGVGSGGSGGAAADAGTAGTTGAGGAAGSTGTGGTGALPTSCAIPIGQINGTDTVAVWDRCDVPQTMVRAVVVDGATDVFGSWPVVGSYTVTPHAGTPGGPTADGQCNVEIRYERPATTCRAEYLFVRLVVSAI